MGTIAPSAPKSPSESDPNGRGRGHPGNVVLTLKVTVPNYLEARIQADAKRRGLTLPRWFREVAEIFLADSIR